MAKNTRRLKTGTTLSLFGVLFLVLSLGVGLVLTGHEQNHEAKAISNLCPAAERCPYPGEPGRLWSCHPADLDGTVTESLCNAAGRIETCGPATTKYCCPAPGAAWTTNLAACPPPATPVPTPVVTPNPPVAVSPSGTISCSQANPTAVQFIWNSVPNAASYYLRIDDSSNGWNPCGGTATPFPGDHCIANIVSTAYTATLPVNKSYSWWVSGVSSGGQIGAASASLAFTIPPVCSQPTPIPTQGRPWDVNQDGVVDIIDIGIIIDNYGRVPILNPRADVNNDHVVDIIDIGIVIDYYGN